MLRPLDLVDDQVLFGFTCSALIRMRDLSAMPVLSEKMGCAFQHDLNLLRVLKQLKYLWNLSKSHLAIRLEQLSKRMETGLTSNIPGELEGVAGIAQRQSKTLWSTAPHRTRRQNFSQDLWVR